MANHAWNKSYNTCGRAGSHIDIHVRFAYVFSTEKQIVLPVYSIVGGGDAGMRRKVVEACIISSSESADNSLY